MNAPIDEEPSLRGRLLKGRYAVLELIGEGGMGSAWLAEDRDLRRRVVVKAPRVEVLADRQFRARFEREVEHLLGLDHPHVTKILDAGTAGVMPFLVLPYLAGGSLQSRLEDSGASLGLDSVLGWLPDVSRALDFIHRMGFVHRDVKPGNIMFDEHGHAFLGDFGIARAIEGSDMTLTQTGTIVGSPRYLAPEIALGHAAGPASDQYSLATIVYVSLARTLPHVGDTPLVIFAQKTMTPPRPLREAAPEVSDAVASCIMRALARDPQDRYASCEAFATAVADAARAPAKASLTEPTRPEALAGPVEGETLRLASASTATVAIDRPSASGSTTQAAFSASEPGPRARARRIAALAVVALVAGAVAVTTWLALRDVGAPSSTGPPSASIGPTTAPRSMAGDPPPRSPAAREGDEPTIRPPDSTQPITSAWPDAGSPEATGPTLDASVEGPGGSPDQASASLEAVAASSSATDTPDGSASMPGRPSPSAPTPVATPPAAPPTVEPSAARASAPVATSAPAQPSAEPPQVAGPSLALRLSAGPAPATAPSVARTREPSPSGPPSAPAPPASLPSPASPATSSPDTQPPRTAVAEPTDAAIPSASPVETPRREPAATVAEVVALPAPPLREPPPAPRLAPLGRNAAGFERAERTKDGAVVVLVTSGSFRRGSTAVADEMPESDLAISAFWLDETEVTWRQWRAYMRANGIATERAPSWSPGPDHPVVNVSWDGAARFCEWAGGRLPTEAEWEYAARGTSSRTYPWGNTWRDGMANWADPSDGFANTAPVGSFPLGAGPFGHLDLAGNAAEWVGDWYAERGYGSGAIRDPHGPSTGTTRVTRGGSFATKAREALRGANRADASPDVVFANQGVRCAMDP